MYASPAKRDTPKRTQPLDADFWHAFPCDPLHLLPGWAIAALTPYTGGPDPGFGHRCARSGYEIMFDVGLIPVWLAVFYLGALDTQRASPGPLIAL